MFPAISNWETDSLLAAAPSITGGFFDVGFIVGGELESRILKRLAEIVQLRKIEMAGLQEVWYLRENAGIADAFGVIKQKATGSRTKPGTKNRKPHGRISISF